MKKNKDLLSPNLLHKFTAGNAFTLKKIAIKYSKRNLKKKRQDK
jgi:hypothetical protein